MDTSSFIEVPTIYNIRLPAITDGLTSVRGLGRCESGRTGQWTMDISNGRGMLGIEFAVSYRFGIVS